MNNIRIKRLVESVMLEASKEDLDSAIKEWGMISDEIDQHRIAFENMIKDKLEKQAALKQTIEKTMDELEVKTHKIDSYVAAIKAAYTANYDASPKELWATALTKVNEATKKVLLDLQTTMKGTKTVDKSFSLKKVTKEGFGDVVSSIGSKIKEIFRDLYMSIKAMDEPVNELENIASKIG